MGYYQPMDMRLRGIDPEVHRAFKMSCVSAGVSMAQQVQSMMLDFIKRQAVVPVPELQEARGK